MDCQTKHAQTQFVLCHAYQLWRNVPKYKGRLQ
jgi:hypothetical protein